MCNSEEVCFNGREKFMNLDVTEHGTQRLTTRQFVFQGIKGQKPISGIHLKKLRILIKFEA